MKNQQQQKISINGMTLIMRERDRKKKKNTPRETNVFIFCI